MPEEPREIAEELGASRNSPTMDEELEYIPWEEELQQFEDEFDREIAVGNQISEDDPPIVREYPQRRETDRKTSVKRRRARKGNSEREYMTAEDVKEFNVLFKDYLKEKRTPNKSVIKKMLEKNRKSGGQIHRFSVNKIQKKLSNMISSYSRKKGH